MTGKMMPETNCAPKLALYRASLRSSNRSSMSASRPKTRTRSWPEKDSSIWPFSAPVFFHCAAKSFWLRTPMMPAATPESGRATRAIRASCQDTMNIMITMPMTVSSELISCAKACWSACWMLSTSLVTRDRTSPRWRVSK